MLKNLVSGADYSLCVLAIFDDGISTLATTKVLGCTQFSTKEDYPECRSLHAHFLGGTLTVMVGGVVVVTLLVFTVAMMMRHRVCGGCQDHVGQSGEFLPAKGVDVYAQTNGNNSMMMVALPNRLLAQQTRAVQAKAKHKGDMLVKLSNEPHCSQGSAMDLVRQKPGASFTPESDKVSFYYSPAKCAHTLPHPTHKAMTRDCKLKLRSSLSREKDTVQGVKQSLASLALAQTAQVGEEISSNWPGERCVLGAKRSCSFDAGDITATTCYSYAKQLSVIWTRRSQSLHSMLVHCASTTSTSSTASEQYNHVLVHGYLHAYASNNSNSNSNSNCSMDANPGDLEESVV